MDTIFTYWKISLAAGLAVLGVVAMLLETVSRAAERILEGSAQIWEVGKLIANNTVHIAILGRINHNVASISEAADTIAQATGRIQKAATSGTKGGGRA